MSFATLAVEFAVVRSLSNLSLGGQKTAGDHEGSAAVLVGAATQRSLKVGGMACVHLLVPLAQVDFVAGSGEDSVVVVLLTDRREEVGSGVVEVGLAAEVALDTMEVGFLKERLQHHADLLVEVLVVGMEAAQGVDVLMTDRTAMAVAVVAATTTATVASMTLTQDLHLIATGIKTGTDMAVGATTIQENEGMMTNTTITSDVDIRHSAHMQLVRSCLK